jgi:hypothetical protein
MPGIYNNISYVFTEADIIMLSLYGVIIYRIDGNITPSALHKGKHLDICPGIYPLPLHYPYLPRPNTAVTYPYTQGPSRFWKSSAVSESGIYGGRCERRLPLEPSGVVAAENSAASGLAGE